MTQQGYYANRIVMDRYSISTRQLLQRQIALPGGRTSPFHIACRLWQDQRVVEGFTLGLSARTPPAISDLLLDI